MVRVMGMEGGAEETLEGSGEEMVDQIRVFEIFPARVLDGPLQLGRRHLLSFAMKFNGCRFFFFFRSYRAFENIFIVGL